MQDLAKLAAWRALNDFDSFCYWLTTTNEATKQKERWPNFEYLSVIGKEYEANKILWVPKSRRMMLTWVTSAYILWEACRYNAYLAVVQSQMEEHAKDLMKTKVKFLWDNMPYWLKYFMFGGNTNATFTALEATLPNGNRIKAVPQGDWQFRYYTPSTVFIDEAAHQEQFEDTVTSIIPFLEKDTKLLMVSSAIPSYFWQVVTSEAVGQKQMLVEPHEDLPLERRKGMQKWQLKHGGVVLQCHYSVDPSKNHEWLEKMDKETPEGIWGPKWEQEMEIVGDAFSGQRVYPQFVDAPPFVIQPHTVPYEARKWLVGDYGWRNPSAFLWIYEGTDKPGEAWSPGKPQHYYVYDEYYVNETSIEDMKYEIAMRCGDTYFEQELIDPSTDAVREGDTATHFWLFNNGNHARMFMKAQTSEEGRVLIREWLHEQRLHIFDHCVNIRREFPKYRHEDWTGKVKDRHNLKEKVVKKDDHTMDALKYFANAVRYDQHPISPHIEATDYIQMVLDKLENPDPDDSVYTAEQLRRLL